MSLCTLSLDCLTCLIVPLAASSAERTTIPYEAGSGRWLIDPAGIISRDDVLYDSYSVQPWEAMPTGGGDLSAMVRFDGTLHLHLTKSDAWGFQAPPDAKPGSRHFNNVSPGHVELRLAPLNEALKASFRQRLDLYRGRVLITFADTASGRTELSVWGHPTRKILVVEVDDPKGVCPASSIVLTEWRDTMVVSATGGILTAREVQTRPARPHMANTGMQDYFDEAHDPLKGRGLGVAIGLGAMASPKGRVDGKTASMILPNDRPAHWYVVIAAAVTPSGSGADPIDAAKRELSDAMKVPLDSLRAEQQAWWRDYWGRSFLRVTSPDKAADWLTAAYHVHLYTLGCTNRGPVPAKWDGGPGLMRGDERTWGLAEWVQEIRFTFMPCYAANRLEIAKGLPDHYSRMLDYLTEQTKKMWGLPGLWIPETVLPWGHAEDWILKDDGRGAEGHYQRWDPKTAPYGKFELYNPYVGFLLTAGLEVCHHYLTHYRYSGDEAFLRDQAYPVVRGVCEFLSGLLRKGDDGRYHLDPANSLETWWMVRDPSDTLDGIRAIFPQFIAMSQRLNRDETLRAKCAEILEQLPDPPLGHWDKTGKNDASVDAYAPAAAMGKIPGNRNFENPELYRVYPFALSGIGSDDVDRARRSFEQRIFVLPQSWSMDPIWAARLGLGETACDLAARHAKQFNRFRYGGWDSHNSSVFPGGLAVVPYLDGAGVSAFALQEILLQSHNDLIRVAPAVAKSWSGIFRLRAEGGFMVGADLLDGRSRFVEIESLLGKTCRIANPWTGVCVVSQGKDEVLRSDTPTIQFDTRQGERYLLTPAEIPLTHYQPAPITDQPNKSPGLPGRD
ncbi:MAG: hypothetical protein JXQ73_04005 [Phycisphaerae bacterium]|nr:hypothetical protein [Phycisphaerae bacterium]